MKNQGRINEITDELKQIPEDSSGNANACLLSYAGPVAEVIERLERRIEWLEEQSKNRQADVSGQTVVHRQLETRVEDLESRPIPDAKLQLGAASIDTRAGLSVSDVVELTRALRDKA